MVLEEINTNELCCVCDDRSTSDDYVCEDCMHSIAMEHMLKHGKL